MNKESFAPQPQNPTTLPIDPLKDIEVIANGGTQFSTGAVRSADKAGVMYHLITPIGLRRIAETYKEGSDKYGNFNWERGMPIGDLLNHAIGHLYAYLSGVPSVDGKTGKVEDDLAHAAWNLLSAMHMEETHSDLDHQLRFKVKDISNPEPNLDRANLGTKIGVLIEECYANGGNARQAVDKIMEILP